MADYIPFISGPNALKLVNSHYSDADFVRIPLDRAEKLSKLTGSANLWIDPVFDGFDDLDSRRSRPWYDFVKDINNHAEFANPKFIANPEAVIVKRFVASLLERCAKYKPAWITVPQLPIVSDASRNRINRALAKASGEWKSSRNFSGRLILPLIFTNQNQINGKTARNPRIKQTERCYSEARADGFWVVDKSLADDSGSKTLRDTRFPAIIELHQELNRAIPSRIRIAGPYWGLNLVLWERGLVDYPAIGVGNSYQYNLAGGQMQTPSAQLAISPLRRRVSVAQLEPWLKEVVKKLTVSHPAYKELEQILNRFSILSDRETARNQVARFYKMWFETLASVPKAGRALALFQDLSAAYALGRSLPPLNISGPSRRPESVAEPLMLSCL